MKLKDGWYAKVSNGDVYWYDEMPEKGKDCWHYVMSIITLYPNRRPMGGLTPQGRGWCDYKSTYV